MNGGNKKGSREVSIILSLVLGMMSSAMTGGLLAEEDAAPPPRTALKVCGDPNAMPASNDKLEGFENKIAKLFADSLKLPLQYYWFPQRFKFIRNSLKNNKTPDGSYQCDLVISVPENFDMAATTQPYYHSTWAMVYVKGRGLDDIKSQDDLANLPPERKKNLRIGLYDVGPATDWAYKHNLLDYMVSYQHMTADVQDYPGRIIEQDLVQDKINVTFEWGPIAGYYAKKIKNPELVVIPMKSEPGIKFDFRFAMATRFGEKAWKQQVNDFITQHREDIRAILAEYGVPLVDEGATKAGDDDNKGKHKKGDGKKNQGKKS
ncbi:MAG TPA: quinoprotein dehydrogenase-associated putative ABC transporter substrate-binding protein [Gammaproteobacteria bacterium]|nr:quinoprotein dehydrogenase-associated putative ABC transporter substrate-binding protein [Gammaproteobacteria bacterium]